MSRSDTVGTREPERTSSEDLWLRPHFRHRWKDKVGWCKHMLALVQKLQQFIRLGWRSWRLRARSSAFRHFRAQQILRPAQPSIDALAKLKQQITEPSSPKTETKGLLEHKNITQSAGHQGIIFVTHSFYLNFDKRVQYQYLSHSQS